MWTYGKLYLALNATTGEMIAAKQIELPQTTGNKPASDHYEVVQALRNENKILRDLDHPNIVQYLGFEEIPMSLTL